MTHSCFRHGTSLRASALALLGLLGVASCGGEEDPFCDGNPPAIVHLPSVVVVDGHGDPMCPPDAAIVTATQGGRESMLALELAAHFVDGSRPCHVFQSSDAFDICPPRNELSVSVTWPGCGTFTKSVVWRGEQITIVTDCPPP